MDHFAKLERAGIMDWGLLQDYYNADLEHVHPTFCNEVSPDTVITMEELVTMLSKADRDRATGPEGLCDDLSAAAPRAMARHMLPLSATAPAR